MEKSERRKALEAKMKEINKNQKDSSLIQFGATKEEDKYVPFGVEQIDGLVGGGVTQGKVTVVYGGKSVGKTTLVLQQIAEAQKQGKICFLGDLEHGWDIKRAKKFGVNLDELVLLENATNAEQVMDAIIELSKEKLIDLAFVDSINAMSPKSEQETKKGKTKSVEDDSMALLARKLGQFFRQVAPHIHRAKVGLIMIGQVRTHGIGSFFTYAGLSGGKALEHWMSTCLFMRAGQKADSPITKFKKYVLDPKGKVRYKTENNEIGFDCVVKLEKTKNSDSEQEGSEIHVPFYYKTGFHPCEEQEEIPIINGGKDEDEKEIINQYLIENEIIESQEKEIKKVKAESEDSKVTVDKAKEVTKKKKRGRPKKKVDKEE